MDKVHKNIVALCGIIIVLIVSFVIYSMVSNSNRDITQIENTKIGLIAGTTGEYAFVGENFVNGAQVALADWNRNNPDRQIELVIEDDGFDPVKGLSSYRKLTSLDDVHGLVNMTSVTIDVIYNDVVETGIPLVQFGEQGIDPQDDNVFQVLEGNIPTAVALGEKVRADGRSNVVVLVSNNATFERFYNGFKSGYVENHTLVKVNPGDTNTIRTQVIKALSLNPDAIVIMGVPGDGALISKEVKSQNQEVALYLDGSAFTGWSEYQKILGDTNILNGDSIVVLKQSAASQAFTSSYQAMHGSEPQVGSGWGYDGLIFLLSTMPEDSKDWPAWTANMGVASVTGSSNELIFDETGVRIPDFFIGQIEDGSIPAN